jgi:hypothetical protein
LALPDRAGDSAMSIPVRLVRAQPEEQPSAIAAAGSAGMTVRGRLIPMALALYLAPALLVVLLVGGLGLLVQAFVRGPWSVVRKRIAGVARETQMLEAGCESKESGSSTTDN